MTTSAGPADGPETTVVRAATAGDAEDVAAIWHAGWADGHLGNVPDELTRHRGRSQFFAETENGPVEVPCHRYTIDLSQPGGSPGTTG